GDIWQKPPQAASTGRKDSAVQSQSSHNPRLRMHSVPECWLVVINVIFEDSVFFISIKPFL
ncbi:hypothetical protein AAEP93_008374, partial [Penicillium crustosum]